MDNIRTDDQKKADESLEQAIQYCLTAYGISTGGQMLNDFAVLCVTSELNQDGIVLTRYPVLMPNGDMPWYRFFGLLEMHKELATRTIGSDNG